MTKQALGSLFPVILSGGVGSRLWPMSRKALPKQFLPLMSNHSMLQDTVDRTLGLGVESHVIVCNEDHRFLVAEQLREIGVEGADIILEPVGRNTAPAVAVAAFKIAETNPDGIMLVMPADHVIRKKDAFAQSVSQAIASAVEGNLVTFGIEPTHPESGYGYIQKGEALNTENAFQVMAFREKPNAETAAAFLADGGYLWNSGLFLFKAKRYLEELQKLSPDMYEKSYQAYNNAVLDLDFLRLEHTSFEAIIGESIDYAVMEHTENAAVIPVSMAWSDVGAWNALWDISEKDENENVLIGEVMTHNVKGSYIRSEDTLTSVIGLDDITVVTTSDAVLVAASGQVQDVKKIVDRLKEQGHEKADFQPTVYRPWGTYRSIDVGTRHQVKHIMVNPGAQLSLQKHYHRAEHWIVVSGTAEVTCDDKVFILQENQSTYIPLGAVHRLANPGKLPLKLIEVQSGSYLGEDDIVRYDDHYGRLKV